MPALAHDAAHEPHKHPRTRRVDILQREADCGRITQAAFDAGTWLRSIYAQQQQDVPDRRLVWVREGAGGIGHWGEKILNRILGGATYRECAEMRGRPASEPDVVHAAR